MPVELPLRSTAVRPCGWRFAFDRVHRLWGGPLRLRTVATAPAVSVVAVSIIGACISPSVRNSLFYIRKDRIVTETSRAVTSAQGV
jgi:hypothetical protein